MALIWRAQMSVGNEEIDRDHRYLVCYINTVTLALQNPEEKEILNTAIAQLYDYAYEHFVREENIQQQISYPELRAHQQEHKRLLEELMNLKNRINYELNTNEIKRKHDELVSLLKHWLIDHVLKTDLKLKEYISKYNHK